MLVVEIDDIHAQAAERASHACRTYSGRPLMPRNTPSAVRTFPNLVASTTSLRRSRIARPTSSSFVKGP